MGGFAIAPHKSSLGMEANIAVILIFVAMAVISWIPYLGWIAWAVPLVFFILEKTSVFVKFQAVQALAIGVVRAAISLILQIFIWILTPRTLSSAINFVYGRGWGAWVVLGTISTIIGIIITLIEVYIIFKAFTYKQVELPGIGPIGRKFSQK